MPSQKYYKVGVLLFDGADILDFAGPIETLSHVSHNRNPDAPDRMFKVVTISRTRNVCTGGSLTIRADQLLDETMPSILDFDILLIPGGPPAVIKRVIEANGRELDIVREYATSQALNPHHEPRLLFSVCTGALLLGAAGVLAGVTVTTHHRTLDALRDICAHANKAGAGSAPTNIVHKRYVDSVLGSGTKLLTAGGISSGLDATLRLVEQTTSLDMAAFVARLMEYDWRDGE